MTNHGEGFSGSNLSQTQSHPVWESGCFLSNRSPYRLIIARTLNKDQKHVDCYCTFGQMLDRKTNNAVENFLLETRDEKVMMTISKCQAKEAYMHTGGVYPSLSLRKINSSFLAPSGSLKGTYDKHLQFLGQNWLFRIFGFGKNILSRSCRKMAILSFLWPILVTICSQKIKNLSPSHC